jgi:tetratricopeptide (TPR) repeat protein
VLTLRGGGWGLVSALTVVFAVRSAAALSTTDAENRARLAISAVEADSGQGERALPRNKKITEEYRIFSGEMLLRTHDYDRAIDELSKVLELHRQGKASVSSYADALYLIGEAYFSSKQMLSARRAYNEILDKGTERPYDAYAGRALSRTVDIALRRNDLASLDAVFAHMATLPASDASGSLQYARGKAYFAKGDFDQARASIQSVPGGSDYAHQAQYLLGVVLLKEAQAAAAPATSPPPGTGSAAAAPATPPARYAAAVEQFRKVTRMPADNETHRHVIDLAWLAMGRLLYESDVYLDAADAYSHVDRNSPEFATMLYELSWVYVRLGDFQRAQRALEVLSITAPQTLEVADGSLLRADLMLRSGEFEGALSLYESVRARFDPIRAQVDKFLASTSDPAVYYDKLTSEDFGSGDQLPPIVLDWAREESEDDNVFAVIDDVSRSRELLRRSRELAAKLNAVLASPTRAKALPEVRAKLQAVLGLINKLGIARYVLAQGMDDTAGDAGGELATVRRERRSLMRRVGFLPVSEGDFLRRDAVGEAQWNTVSQNLQKLTLEVDRLRAIVNGLNRVMQDADRQGVARDPATRARFAQEIAANERDIDMYQQRIKQYREGIEMGRAQIGFGDQRYIEDDQVRARFRQLFQREVDLCASGQDRDAADFARQIQPLLQRAATAEDRLAATRARYEAAAGQAAGVLLKSVSDEVAHLETYAAGLEELDQQARILVGEVAMKNFGLVRERLKGIVLRADVGVVQQGWEVREEERLRVRDLQRERAREEQNLNDELREVLDDSEDDL